MKKIALLFTFSLYFFSCEKNYLIPNKEVPKWLKAKIKQDEQIIKDSPQSWLNYGAWLRYNCQVALLILIFSLTNCEKKDELVNKTTDAQIVGFVAEKCYCCWGWIIDIGNIAIKTKNIPNLNYSPDSTVFPIKARITIGSKTIDCSKQRFDMTQLPDYYEIKDFTLIK